jgi:very-short-patch-repair endonuclease
MTNSYNENLHNSAIGKLYQYGRELRQSSTNAEKILWGYLRGRKLNGLKFRRQHPMDKFIADFYCHEKKLVVEVDGAIHDVKENAEYDKSRTRILEGSGIKVIRFRNEEVENKIELVINEIRKVTES